jgi:transposase
MAEIPCPNCIRLEREIAELRARDAQRQIQIERLTRLLDEQRRTGKRQAAPFAKGPPKPEPKKPGRKPGKDYGTKAHREPPKHIDEVHDAPLPDECPDCGGDVDETHIDQQYQVEIPRRPIHRQFNIHVGCCQKCRRRVQGRHPLQTSDALGAAAAQLGPDAQAAVVEFNKQAGMSHGKISRVFQTLFGIRLSRGGSTHVVLRAARRCEPVYTNICAAVKTSPWTVLDETGWHVGGQNSWMHALVGKNATAYVIDPTRSGQPAERILGLDYAGIMIHDGWSPYDNFLFAEHQQCLAHLLRRSHELLETATRGAVCFPRRVSELLQQALTLRDRHADGQLSDHGLAVCRGRLQNVLLDAIYPSKTHKANDTFAQHLWNHKDDLLTFLKHPGLDATNWRGELAIRFGVILRKVWGGNRTWIGARAQAVLMSVWRTCWQRGQNAIDFLSHLLRRCRPELVGLPP